MWNWNYALEIFPAMLSAMKMTVAATVVGFAVAVVFGLVLAIARRSSSKPISFLALAFIDFIRNTPLLVQLYFIYLGLPAFGIKFGPFTAGVIGLGLHYSTYLSEVYRSGIDSVPKGQWEAARALNFTTMQTWKRLILPQAIPPVIPVMGNYLIVMFKETPLLSAISLVEMLMTAKMLGSETWRYLEPVTIAGFLFLVLSLISSYFVQRLEVRFNRTRQV